MQVEILNAEAPVWLGEAQRLLLPTPQGEIGILNHHVALQAALSKGYIKIYQDSDTPPVLYAIEGGWVHVEMNAETVRILLTQA